MCLSVLKCYMILLAFRVIIIIGFRLGCCKSRTSEIVIMSEYHLSFQMVSEWRFGHNFLKIQPLCLNLPSYVFKCYICSTYCLFYWEKNNPIHTDFNVIETSAVESRVCRQACVFLPSVWSAGLQPSEPLHDHMTAQIHTWWQSSVPEATDNHFLSMRFKCFDSQRPAITT